MSAKTKPVQQPALFDPETGTATGAPQAEAGEVVIHRGYYGGIVPFWQIRFTEYHDGRGWSYYACPVPYGALPGEVGWLHDGQFWRTGLRWRVPTWDELSSYSRGRWEFVEHLNFPSHGWYEPYAEESELVALLAPLGPWQGWTDDNFTARFQEIRQRLGVEVTP